MSARSDGGHDHVGRIRPMTGPAENRERGLTFADTPSAWLALTTGIDGRAKQLVALMPGN